MKILIAEDSLASRQLLTMFLERRGHETIVAMDGAEAWWTMQQSDAPKLVILDWMMPVVEGIEVCRRIRTLETDQPTYIIMLTCKADKANIIEGLEAGADDYMTKPFDFDELGARISVGERMLQMHSKLHESQIKSNRIEASLRESKELLSQTQAIAMVGGWAINLDTRFSSWTEETHRLFGFMEDAIPDPEEASVFFQPEDWRSFIQAIRRADASGEPFDLDVRLALSSAGQRWVRIAGKRADTGRERKLSCIVQDITDKKRLEILHEDVERITRHDLRTPLMGIIGLPQTLLDDPNLTEDQRDSLKLIESGGYTILNMINLSLVLFKIESGKYEYTPEHIDLLPVIRKILEELNPLIQGKSLVAHLLVEDKPPMETDVFWVQSEALLSYSMLANLLKNAVEAAPHREDVTISLFQAEDCRIRIRNKGEVPVELRPVFFKKYETSGKKRGTGLGTYSAKMMAQAMGGDVELDFSEPGATTVTVRLPCPTSSMEAKAA